MTATSTAMVATRGHVRACVENCEGGASSFFFALGLWAIVIALVLLILWRQK